MSRGDFERAGKGGPSARSAAGREDGESGEVYRAREEGDLDKGGTMNRDLDEGGAMDLEDEDHGEVYSGSAGKRGCKGGLKRTG